MGTAHTAGSINVKAQNSQHGAHIVNYRTAATLYTPQTGISVFVNTLTTLSSYKIQSEYASINQTSPKQNPKQIYAHSQLQSQTLRTNLIRQRDTDDKIFSFTYTSLHTCYMKYLNPEVPLTEVWNTSKHEHSLSEVNLSRTMLTSLSRAKIFLFFSVSSETI
jgi:hypothetical protein